MVDVSVRVCGGGVREDGEPSLILFSLFLSLSLSLILFGRRVDPKAIEGQYSPENKCRESL